MEFSSINAVCLGTQGMMENINLNSSTEKCIHFNLH